MRLCGPTSGGAPRILQVNAVGCAARGGARSDRQTQTGQVWGEVRSDVPTALMTSELTV